MFDGPEINSKLVQADRLIAKKRLELVLDINSTDASAISLETPLTVLTAAGAETRTLANGYNGQIKVLIGGTLTGAVTVTPTGLEPSTNIVMTTKGGCWMGIFYDNAWHTLSLTTGAALS
jgi:hypothetical protein